MIYRSVVAAVVRALAAETMSGTGGQDFEPKVQAAKQKGAIVGKEEAFLVDCWVFGRLHKGLSSEHWRALVAKYSTHEDRKHEAILALYRMTRSPAPTKFREMAVLTWAIPQLAGVKDGKRSAHVLPAAWYDMAKWDSDGRPDSTQRRWRNEIRKGLDNQVNEALAVTHEFLAAEGLIVSEAA
jgi:hypothetical protein